jgi:hypothetical protein
MIQFLESLFKMRMFRVLMLCALASNIYFVRLKCSKTADYKQHYKSVLIDKIKKQNVDENTGNHLIEMKKNFQ